MNLTRLRSARTPAMVSTGLGAIVAGAWTAAAELLGATLGASIGIALTGVAILVIEGLSAPSQSDRR